MSSTCHSAILGMRPLQPAPVDPSINNYKTRFENVDVRVYDPVSRSYDKDVRSPLLIYIHGGGWVKMSVDVYDLSAHPYPAALLDIDVAYRFLIEHATSYKIDPNRIVIAGDSAGGNLAAAYCLKLRDTNRIGHPDDVVVMPKLQALIYPALQAVDLKTPSCQSSDPILPREAMGTFWSLYLTGSEEGAMTLVRNEHHSVPEVRTVAQRYVKHNLIPHHLISSSYSAPKPIEQKEAEEIELPSSLASKMDILSSDPYLSPLIAEDLSELPNAYVIACQYDVLRDDAILYARRLSAAGVEVETRIVMGAWHGIMFRTTMGSTRKGIQMTKDMTRFIEENA